MLTAYEYISKVSMNFSELRDAHRQIDAAADAIIQKLKAGGKVIFCGNGGSAADAQHLAAELMGRFLIDRDPLPAVALTVDTSALTAIANDYGYEEVFARQLRGLGQPGDTLIAISTSGNSSNVVRAVEYARTNEIYSIALTGRSGGRLKDLVDLCIAAPSDQTSHIQEMHVVIGHIICGIVEDTLCSRKQWC